MFHARVFAQSKHSFGFKATAKVLIDKYIAIGGKFFARGRHFFGRLVRHAVGSAHKQDWQWCFDSVSAHDHCLQPNAVAHRNHHFLVIKQGFRLCNRSGGFMHRLRDGLSGDDRTCEKLDGSH